MINLIYLFILTLMSYFPLVHSAPAQNFISGNHFRECCNWVWDEEFKNLDPKEVKKGDTIFIKTDYLTAFFSKVHPKITEPYILVTHNSDYPAPGKSATYLDDNKLIAWFGINIEDSLHKKLHPLPLGFNNKYWDNSNMVLIESKANHDFSRSRKILLYLNFSPGTCPAERKPLINYFKGQPYCYYAKMKRFKDYLYDTLNSKFVLSPRGNGLDCYRTWEALLLGAIPIVRTSLIDPLYEDLPVLIIENWKTLDEAFLKKKYAQMQLNSYNYKKLYMDYWIQQIMECQEKARSS